MAATDARPVPRKNAAWRVYFAIRKNDGTLITTWAGQDSEVSLDGAAFSDCTNEATEVGTSGCGYLDLTSSEMNADEVTIKITVTNTSALPLVLTVFPEEAGDYRVADTQKVDVETIKTQALTAAAGITFGVYVGGTAAAAVASTALSTATWTGTLATNIGTTNTTVATNLDATVTSRMATYTQPTGFLAATFPATIASTTNITGGTITTVTNLTNAPTSGDLTATMKASVTAAVPTVANIADGVWDEARAGHTTAGTFGFYLDAAISGISGGSGATAQQVWEYATRTLTGAVELDSAAILAVADQVWDEAMSGHTTAGTYGGRIVRATNSNNEVQITGSNHIAADIYDLQSGVISAGDFAANAITASALATDAVAEIQSGLASQSSVDTLTSYVDTEVAAIKAKTDNLPSDPADASDIASSFSTVNTKLDTIDDFLDTEIAAIKAKTDNLPTDPADQSLVEAAITAATSPLATPAQVNAEVVDVLSVDTFAELSAPPAATSSLKDKLTWLFMYARNKVTQTATTRTLYRDDTTTVAGTSGTSDNGTTFTKGEDA